MPRSRSGSRSNKSKKKKSRTRSSSRETSRESRRYYESKSSRRDRSRDRYKSRDESRDRNRHKRSRDRDYDRAGTSRDYDREHDRYSSKSSKKSSRDSSRDRYRSKNSKKRRHRSSSSSSRSDHTSSRDHRSVSKSSEISHRRQPTPHRSRSKSTHGSPGKSFIVERYNFSEAVNVLDNARETIDDIERDEFVPQSFSSSSAANKSSTVKNLPEKVKIDLKNEKVIVPAVEAKEPEDELFHPEFFGEGTEEDRMRRWIRKLLNYRQRIREARRNQEMA